MWVVTLIPRLRKTIVSISIHTTHVGGDTDILAFILPSSSISIHTTRVGGDPAFAIVSVLARRFQSTPPVWVVTKANKVSIKELSISIHTTRVGGDIIKHKGRSDMDWFQSTPPVWVVTLGGNFMTTKKMISIHTTRVGGDAGTS